MMGWGLGVGALAACVALAWAVLLRPADVSTPPPLAGRFQQVALEHGGRLRSYGVYLPQPDAASRGMLVALHGSLGSGTQFRQWTGGTLDALADRLGVAVVYPDGWKGHWNDCRRAGTYAAKSEQVDDVGFLEQLLVHLGAGKAPRVGVVGYSNGGSMALRWALEGSAPLDGIVLVGAAVPEASNMVCAPGRRLPRALLVAGTADRISPYDGGRVTVFGSDRGVVLSAADSARWLAGPGATAGPVASAGPVRRQVWTGPQGERAELVTLDGAGHTVPQPRTRFPRLLGPTEHGIDVADLAAETLGWR